MKFSAGKVSVIAIAAAIIGCSPEGGPSDGKGAGYRLATAVRSDVVRTVEATGTVTPRNSSSGIPVGAQVNGRLIKLFVDYNSVVTNGQVVALIDPLVYAATYKSAIAQLHSSQANVNVKEALLRSAEAAVVLADKTYERKRALVEKSLAPVADLDSALESRDKAKASLDSARAELESAKASVEQAEASADKAKADLEYCTIVSPVDGVVIDRKVEEGETVVSSMNAVPILTIAEDLKTVWVEATVPEADVGNIKVGQEVSFTADAYRRKFVGRVKQVRRAATTTNNVVTFPVIIEAENPDEMLFPGMTATLSIETARADNAIVVPTAAFRFRPKDGDRIVGEVPSGRKVWILRPDGALEAKSIESGVSDDSFAEILENGLSEGSQVVIGYRVVSAAIPDGGDDTKNPFMPKPPKHGTQGTAPEPAKK